MPSRSWGTLPLVAPRSVLLGEQPLMICDLIRRETRRHDPRWLSGDDRIGRHILRHNGARANDRPAVHGRAGENDGAVSQPHVVLYVHLAAQAWSCVVDITDPR